MYHETNFDIAIETHKLKKGFLVGLGKQFKEEVTSKLALLYGGRKTGALLPSEVPFNSM